MGGGNNTHIYRRKVSTKTLVYFLIIGLIPLSLVSSVLIVAGHNQMASDAINRQKALAGDLSRNVDDYLISKTNSLSLIARLYVSSPQQIGQSLTALLEHDPSLQKITVLTTDGAQQTAKMVDGNVKITSSRIKSDETLLDTMAEKSQLLTIGHGINNEPQIIVGMPIAKDQKSAGSVAPPNANNSAKKILGGIIATYSVSDEWRSIIPDRKDTGKYAYVVDGSGSVVYHPDQDFMSTHAELKDVAAVQNFTSGSLETQTNISETNEKVISTPVATKSGWGVIVEEPVSSIYASANNYVQFASSVGVLAITFSIFASLFFTQQITRPIRKLVLGARRFAQGISDQKIDIKTKDEFHEIAEAFNGMSGNVNNMVTSLKANNQDLTFEQSKLHSIMNSVSDGIIAVNRRGEIIAINLPAANYVNQIPYSLKGKLVSEIFPWKQDGTDLQLNFLHTGVQNYSDITLAKSESMAYLDLTVEVLDEETDIAAIITIHDQTASRELSFMKLDFVAIAAHELRTPLTVISGYLDMLTTEAAKELSAFNLESLQRAVVGASQLRALINKLLNIARIERGDMEIFIEKLNLTDLVTKNVEEHQPIAKQKDQVLVYSSNTNDTVYVPGDPASIVEVLNNLIGNGLKYTPKNGHIQVNLTASSDQVRIEVVDNGPGIPEDLRDKLFTKFYRAERSMIAGTRGTGLGLFISKTIIELQHGTIGIEPNAGSGSTFYFTLPIYDPARDDEIVAKNLSGGIHGWFKKRSNS